MTEEEQRRSIVEQGFRSPSIEQVCVPTARLLHPDWHALANDTNEAGQKLLVVALHGAAGRAVSSPYAVATRLFIRTMSSFQGALVLAERGMPIEAQSLVRACFENAILIGALKEFSEDVLRHLEGEERAGAIARLTTLSTLLEANSNANDAYAAQVKQAIATIKATPKRAYVGLKELSIRAGLLAIYLDFRQLSSNSAHASLSSLQAHLWILDGQIEGLQVGPDLDRLPATLALACHAIISTSVFLAPVIGHFDLDHEFLALNDRLSELSTRLPQSEILALMP